MGPTEARRAAVVGSPVSHSLSPVLHLAAYRALGLESWTYERIECDAAGMPALVESLGPEWAGLSVTMPGKHAALAVASGASHRAVAVGAANTLVHKESGDWYADCTDVDGVVGALRAAGYRPADGAAAVVLGAGGTACAALAGLADLGIGSVSVVVRDPARAGGAQACADRLGLAVDVIPWAGADFGALASSSAVLVSTVPAAAVESIVDDLAQAPHVLDVIYHPWPTALATAVGHRGGRLATGLDMLLHQAFVQVEHFTVRPAPQEAMRAALREASGGVLDLPLDPDDPDRVIRAATVSELKPFAVKVIVEPYNPEWPAWYAEEAAAIHAALGPRVLRLEHTGSTSVPGLPAKPIIDMLLLVADPADESAYIPALERAGYKLRVREPDWYEHRLLRRRTEDGDPHDVNLHVHAPDSGAPEITRILAFRDWLRTHPADRDLYARTKLQLSKRDWKYVQHYADAKTAVVEDILARATAPGPHSP